MKHIIEINFIDGIVWVTSVGNVEFDLHNKAIADAAKLAVENQSEAILFDLRNAIFAEYHVAGIKHAEAAPALGIRPEYKIAILGIMDQIGMLEYFENVAINRGIMAKVYTVEGEAVAWLKESF